MKTFLSAVLATKESLRERETVWKIMSRTQGRSNFSRENRKRGRRRQPKGETLAEVRLARPE